MENFFLTEFCPSLYSLNLVHTYTDNPSHDDSQTISLLKGNCTSEQHNGPEKPITKESKSKINIETPFTPLFLTRQ